MQADLSFSVQDAKRWFRHPVSWYHEYENQRTIGPVNVRLKHESGMHECLYICTCISPKDMGRPPL